MMTVLSADLLLARRAAAGQDEAWRQIVDQLGDRIYSVAWELAGSADGAEDLTQEVFLKLHQNLRRYRGDVPFVAWALRLSRNCCVDAYRRRHRLRRYGPTVSSEALIHLPGADDPGREAERREASEAIHTALAALPDPMAEAVILCDLQGWTMTEVASYADVALGTIKSRLFRARKLLADRLRPWAPSAREQQA